MENDTIDTTTAVGGNDTLTTEEVGPTPEEISAETRAQVREAYRAFKTTSQYADLPQNAKEVFSAMAQYLED